MCHKNISMYMFIELDFFMLQILFSMHKMVEHTELYEEKMYIYLIYIHIHIMNNIIIYNIIDILT